MRNSVIAWRNLWRNKRRTLITVASIFFGVLLAVVMSSMQEGSYANMIDNVVKFYSGYIQIHDEEYWENKTLYYSFDTNEDLYKTIESVDKITLINPRLESYALASSTDITQPAMIVGVDPEKEEQLTGLSKWIVDGKFLSADDKGILLSAGLAKNLKVSANDTLALLSQGYYGNTIAQLFPVRGVLDFPSPELNKRFAYLALKNAQEFYGAEGKLTSLVLMVDNYEDVKATMDELKMKIKSPYSAMSWDEMQPELVQVIEGDRAGGLVMKAILYMIIAFGILGTIMMMMAERRKELGVMVAVGMQKYKLAGILFYETMFMGLIGVIAGILVSIPIIIYMLHNPIPLTGDAAIAMKDMGIEPVMMFTAAPKVFVNQIITVLAITFLISFYPLINVGRMIVIKYLRD
jgi:ABC-type lipoprotein release transport system permease subunit